MKRLYKLVIGFLLLFIGYIYLPDLIHYALKNKTSDKQKIFLREEYKDISNSSLSNEERKEEIYLWFQVRGIPIDEGHFEKEANVKWIELFQYYKMDFKTK
jgi:hypothetical protein